MTFVKLTVDGRVVVKAGRAKAARALRLRGLRRTGRLTVRMDLRTRSGKRFAGTRVYPACR